MKVPLPPRIARRAVLAPSMVVAAVLMVSSTPLWVVAAAFASRYAPGRWRPLRIAWFFLLYLLIESVVLVVLAAVWVASGFGRHLDRPRFRDANYAVMAWFLRRMVVAAERTFHVRIVQPDGPAGVDVDRPLIVMSRHAGPGDSLLLVDAVMNRLGRRPRVVLKDLIQLEPAADVLLNRVPSVFIRRGGRDRHDPVGEIREMAASMGPGDAFVIFPEGGNFTEHRRRRIIDKLRHLGRHDLARRAHDLEHVLLPRTAGVLAALDGSPGADLLIVGHTGLEELNSVADVWRGLPMDGVVTARTWRIDNGDLPPPEAREQWLHDRWQEMDEWISGLRAAEGP
ncbi:MAG: 1-acyl-sn-glycerol-3-phosphate acyltransferase [Actinomycetota bacterium]|nr:1-acyl-sn-glycerol-3-phosphate acyltransferase [Actinomycetota bacterium]